MKATRANPSVIECPYCHKEVTTKQALSSHLAYKHSTSLQLEKSKLKSDGDVKKALAATQENVGRMAATLSDLSGETQLALRQINQLALASWYASQAAESYAFGMAARLTGDYEKANKDLASWEGAHLKSRVEFKKFEALVKQGGA